MIPPSPPAGYQGLRLPVGSAWVLPAAKKPILTAWNQMDPGQPLSRAARRHPQAVLFRGRATVVSFPCAGWGETVVRPCWHGGYWGRLARDLYVGPGRAAREIACSARLRSQKIPTPEILAVLFYPAGCFLRIDVVTAAIPAGRDLVSFLSSRPGPTDRKNALGSVRSLLSSLYRRGIVHPDLNARNILLSHLPKGRWQAWLLDVDAVRFERPRSATVDSANRHRLLRSLLKRARLGDLGMRETDVSSLWHELFPA